MCQKTSYTASKTFYNSNNKEQKIFIARIVIDTIELQNVTSLVMYTVNYQSN